MPFKKGQPTANPRGREKIYNLPHPWNRKYSRAQSQAKYRKEEWAFTAESWYAMWVNSGKMEYIGKHSHCYCMVRKDEVEAWGPHNCIIVTRRMHLKKVMYENCHNLPKTNWKDEHGV